MKTLTIRKLSLSLGLLILTGCAAIGGMKLNELYGPAEPRERQVATLPAVQLDYWQDVEPIVENRCVVCHACYDAPCQLKLSAIEGMERGATLDKVYNSARLTQADPTRLFIDAQHVAEWRQKGFHPVLNEHEQSAEANRAAGVMYQMLQLKAANPLPDQKILGDEFDLSLDRSESCPKASEFDGYAKDHPLWGMPYALPGLAAQEQRTLQTWLEQGALYTPRAPLPQTYQQTIAEWEQFLNQDSNKSRLVSRYIYEHLFLGNLYFDELGHEHFFRLVRSATPPGQPLQLITTRRPYDDPGVERVYYRFREYQEAIVAKTHMPYALNAERMARWQALFFDKPYSVDSLPGYDPAYVANPFKVFYQLPVTSRYQFMLDEAQYTVMGFIKGPVCRGQVALNVINDQFWVFFVKPNETQDGALSEFLNNNYAILDMPAEEGNIYRPLAAWRKYSEKQREFLKLRDDYLNEIITEARDINLDLIWDGDGNNDNAALTVFRHFDSATVAKGLQGGEPKTAWVLGYLDLERIHYLLVAGYDVYGNLGHQLLSRLYMDFLRMDSESMFLFFLPQEAREALRQEWYRDADEELMTYLTAPEFENRYQQTGIEYNTDNPKSELFKLLQEKLQKVLPTEQQLTSLPDQSLAAQLQRVEQYPGNRITEMPENAIVLIETPTGDELFTLLRNNAHLNMTSMFSEQKNRIPEEDRLAMMRGVVGSYPNAYFKVAATDVKRFVEMLGDTADAAGYSRLVDSFGIRRTDNRFWLHSDRVHHNYQQSEPLNFGLLDYNRLENR